MARWTCKRWGQLMGCLGEEHLGRRNSQRKGPKDEVLLAPVMSVEIRRVALKEQDRERDCQGRGEKGCRSM